MIELTERDRRDRDDMARRVGAELRKYRTAHGPNALSPGLVGSLFGWQRDALYKIERGERHVSLFDYLQLMWLYKETCPGHPALVLAQRLLELDDTVVKRWPRKSAQGDKWSFCLNAAMIAAEQERP